MFWFDRADPRATFVDVRRERHTLPDVSSKGGSRELVIDPDELADFTDLPYPDDTFALVVFDPPHFERNGATGWVGLKYGTLKGDWPEMLRAGFAECFRVLRPHGTLIFKWCADEIPLSRILFPQLPILRQRETAAPVRRDKATQENMQTLQRVEERPRSHQEFQCHTQDRSIELLNLPCSAGRIG